MNKVGSRRNDICNLKIRVCCPVGIVIMSFSGSGPWPSNYSSRPLHAACIINLAFQFADQGGCYSDD